METWNIPFSTQLTSNNRITIPDSVIKSTGLKEGDLITLTVTGIHRKKDFK